MRSELLLSVVLVAACTRAVDPKPVVVETPPPRAMVTPPSDPRLMPDEEVGPLIERLSEKPGDFPSENYVSNELSLVDVATALRNPKVHDRAYVGVGPEQNFTYLSMLEPRVAYIVDIRRGNLLEHMFFRACFEVGKTRAEFMSALLSRREASDVKPDEALRDEGVARTKALLDRLHIAHSAADDKLTARIQGAFATHGLAIAYTMLNNGRQYPSLSESLALPGSFVESEDSYARVRRLVMENRVIPVVGDFGGTHALRAVAADMKARGVLLGAFYTSNVEQYLFDQHHYGEFVESVAAMPRDDDSLIVRVWFDQGRKHPQQRPKVRTTQLAISANAFLERASSPKPFSSYWQVVNQPSSPP